MLTVFKCHHQMESVTDKRSATFTADISIWPSVVNMFISSTKFDYLAVTWQSIVKLIICENE